LIKSTLTTKSQTTIPKPVRSALRLKPGDEIAYEIIEGRRVVLTRAEGEPAEDPFATFSEWDGPADRKAYAGL
jgi:antitoxin PrlF